MTRADAHGDPPTASHQRGRPRNAEPSASVTTWLPARDHDKLIQIASRHDVSVSSLVRSLVTHKLRGNR